MSRNKRKKQHPLVQVVIPTRLLAQPMPQRNESSVARLMSQITAEYQAARWGLSGLAYGVSQHQFITARMEGMERAHEQLVELVGDEMEATRLVVEQLDKSDREGKGL